MFMHTGLFCEDYSKVKSLKDLILNVNNVIAMDIIL